MTKNHTRFKLLSLALALTVTALGSGCDTNAATQKVAASSASVQSVQSVQTGGSTSNIAGMQPQAPFDEKPITPVETAGASRNDY